MFDIDELLGEMGYDAVFIGSGAGLPKFMGIPGEQANGVFSANEYPWHNKYEMKIWVSDNLVTDESISFEPGESGWLIDADGIMMYEDNELYEEKISYRVDGDKLYLEPLSEYETAYYYIRTLTDTELILEWINVHEKVNKYNEKYHFIRVK